MSEWTETVGDGSRELCRGRWTLVAWPSGRWEAWLCGTRVDSGQAPQPMLDSATTCVLERAAELAEPMTGDVVRGLRRDVEALRACLRALLPDRTALGELALELYSNHSDKILGARAVVTMPLDGQTAEIAIAHALRHELERVGEALAKAVREAYAKRTKRMDALERCAEALRALIVSCANLSPCIREGCARPSTRGRLNDCARSCDEHASERDDDHRDAPAIRRAAAALELIERLGDG